MHVDEIGVEGELATFVGNVASSNPLVSKVHSSFVGRTSLITTSYAPYAAVLKAPPGHTYLRFSEHSGSMWFTVVFTSFTPISLLSASKPDSAFDADSLVTRFGY